MDWAVLLITAISARGSLPTALLATSPRAPRGMPCRSPGKLFLGHLGIYGNGRGRQSPASSRPLRRRSRPCPRLCCGVNDHVAVGQGPKTGVLDQPQLTRTSALSAITAGDELHRWFVVSPIAPVAPLAHQPSTITPFVARNARWGRRWRTSGRSQRAPEDEEESSAWGAMANAPVARRGRNRGYGDSHDHKRRRIAFGAGRPGKL